MTWTVTKEESFTTDVGELLHVRAIIDIDNEQAEIKELIAALGKHVKMEPPDAG